MSREESLDLLVHYVGNGLLTARVCLKNGEEIDKYRIVLISQLEKLEPTDEVNRTVTMLRERAWNSSRDIDYFNKEYSKMHLDDEVKAVVKQLFGSRR